MRNQETPGRYLFGLVVICAAIILIVGMISRVKNNEPPRQTTIAVTNVGQPVVPEGYQAETNLVTVTGSARAEFAE